MAVNGSEEVRQLTELQLMGHLLRRAGFGATRDALEAALGKATRPRWKSSSTPNRPQTLRKTCSSARSPIFTRPAKWTSRWQRGYGV